MKKIILLNALIAILTTCRAQQIYPLNTYYRSVPNYSYMKDLNNYLPSYIGTYKATYQTNEITLYITNKIKYLIDTKFEGRKFYRDVLQVKYVVKEISSGVILQDTQNPVNITENEIISMGTNTNDNNSVSLRYSGTTCGIGWGRITLKKINSTQISWSYFPNDSIFIAGECPNSQNIKVYLPETENLIFTKQ